ncbi:MAG: hypothetical protein R3Y13_00765 [bacterium]
MNKEDVMKKFSIKVNYYRKLIQYVIKSDKVTEIKNYEFDINLLKDIDNTLLELINKLKVENVIENEVAMIQYDLQRICDKLESLIFGKYLACLVTEEIKDYSKEEENLNKEENKTIEIIEDQKSIIENESKVDNTNEINIIEDTTKVNDKNSIITERVLKRIKF